MCLKFNADSNLQRCLRFIVGSGTHQDVSLFTDAIEIPMTRFALFPIFFLTILKIKVSFYNTLNMFSKLNSGVKTMLCF